MTHTELKAFIREDLGGVKRLPPMRLVTVPGLNPGVGTTAEGVWANGGVHSYPARTGQQIEVVSSSSQDDPTLGGSTGAWNVRIEYLSAPDYRVEGETIELRGTTAVASIATNIARILRAYVTLSGSSKAAVGQIDLRHVANTPIYDAIYAGTTTTLAARLSIPHGVRAYVVAWSAGSRTTGITSDAAIYTLGDTVQDYRTDQSPTPPPEVQREIMQLSSGQWRRKVLEIPRILRVGDDIAVQAIGVGATIVGTAEIEIVFVETGESYADRWRR